MSMRVFKIAVNHNLCTGCNICVVSCPINFNQLRHQGLLEDKNAVILVKNGIAKPIYVEERSFNCDGCGVCVKECPQKALQIKIIEKE